MARAKIHYIPGQVWHLTHRCHRRDFLLKLKMERRKWVQWLYVAKKQYGLVILNYCVTSNHIHLLVQDAGERDIIPRSIMLIAGRTGQEYNIRKKRKGAFWEDRYHATAVEAEPQVNESLANSTNYRQSGWSENVAVGSRNFVDTIHSELGLRGKGWKILKHDIGFQLREDRGTYTAKNDSRNEDIGALNTYD